jgi:LysM repeat protein
MKRRLMMAVAAGLIGALFLAATLVSAADGGPPSGCPAYYAVRWGDTLAKIAAQRGLPLRDLLELNRGRVRNPDLIYAGQLLCVPAERRATLQATYHFRLAGDASTRELLAQGGYLGRIASYGVQHTDFFSTTFEITSTFAAFPPLLIGVRNGATATDYTLYVIGDGALLAPLVLTDTQALASVLPLDSGDGYTPDIVELGAGRADRATVALHLETAGVYFPFALTLMARFPTVERVLDVIDQEMIAFAIAPAGPQYPAAYYVVMRLKDDIVGPFGATRALNCSRWSGWGWFYRWLRGWYGC